MDNVVASSGSLVAGGDGANGTLSPSVVSAMDTSDGTQRLLQPVQSGQSAQPLASTTPSAGGFVGGGAMPAPPGLPGTMTVGGAPAAKRSAVASEGAVTFTKLKGVDGFDDWMELVLDRAGDKSTKMWAERITQSETAWNDRVTFLLKEQQQATDTKIASAIAESEIRTNTKFEELRELIKEGARTGSTCAPPSANGTIPQHNDFVTTCVELKSFINDWDNRQAEGLSSDQVLAFCGMLKTRLEANRGTVHLAAMLHWDGIPNLLNYPYYTKMRIPFSDNVSMQNKLMVVKAVMTIVVTGGDCFKVNGRVPRTSLEQSPAEQALSAEVARFYQTLRFFGVPNDGAIKSRWIRGVHVRVEIKRGDMLLATFSTSQCAWALQCGALQQVVHGFNETAFMAQLR